MTPKTVKSGIFLPNMTTFIPLFFITFKIIYNFNILQRIFFIFPRKTGKSSPLKGLNMLSHRRQRSAIELFYHIKTSR
jgi:hypothetical protein